ncbi:hypothetical protein ONE63_008479 [Megalurothrips usitatus]|uniref:Uncharacterized protein n=1 Tax=Megalurothrips usitatus TaxID=439358 RepID=A0AAV7XLB2_9NEOP|nr:hypothetical protein ONE63_008479 [Megalurothrips usitatus]
MNVNQKGVSLFWENYKCAFEWNNGSRVAHWKARAKALEAENAILRDFIQREFPVRSFCLRIPFHPLENSYRNKEEVFPNFEEATENETVYSEPQIDEELLAFYEKTFRHKIERSRFLYPLFLLCACDGCFGCAPILKFPLYCKSKLSFASRETTINGRKM